MEEKRINTSIKINNSLMNLFNNIFFGTELNREDIINSLFGIVVLDLLINKESMVENITDVDYESKMSDTQLENILLYLDIENIDEDKNGATIFASIRNKLAHGDYYLKNDNIYFRINDKDCKVNLYQFLNYYFTLTNGLNYRFKGKKYIKYQMVNKSFSNVDSIIKTDKDIYNFLRSLSLNEYIFKRKDGKELSSSEKDTFFKYTMMLRELVENNYNYTDKDYDNMIKKMFADDYYVEIKKHKMYKVNEEEFEEIKRRINFSNDLYENNKKHLKQILYTATEKIYVYMENKINNNQVKYSFATGRNILCEMLSAKIYDYKTYLDKIGEKDPWYVMAFPDEEFVLSLIVTMIYFVYCYPLEKLFKNNKVFECNSNDIDFSKIDLSEIIPKVKKNKLYEIGKNNRLQDLEKIIKSCVKKINELENKREKVKNQYNNVLKKYNETKNVEYNNIVIKLKNILEDINNNISKIMELYKIKKEELDNLNEILLKDNNIFYSYTVINGIRNAICHGNIKYSNLYNGIKGLLIEFSDIHENEEQFKLDIDLYSLMSLTEKDNLDYINNFYRVKKIKSLLVNKSLL